MYLHRLLELSGISLNESGKKFYHGSYEKLPVGTVLTPRGKAYEKDWSETSFYSALEHHRPHNMLSHQNAVFMCSDPDDVDAAGGATDWLLTVVPQGKVEQHDINWGSEISSLIDDGFAIDSEEIAQAAANYWSGKPHHSENVWEYLTTAATVIAVEEY